MPCLNGVALHIQLLFYFRTCILHLCATAGVIALLKENEPEVKVGLVFVSA